MTQQMYLPTFFVRQRFAMTTNRYELYAPTPAAGSGSSTASPSRSGSRSRSR